MTEPTTSRSVRQARASDGPRMDPTAARGLDSTRRGAATWSGGCSRRFAAGRRARGNRRTPTRSEARQESASRPTESPKRRPRRVRGRGDALSIEVVAAGDEAVAVELSLVAAPQALQLADREIAVLTGDESKGEPGEQWNQGVRQRHSPLSTNAPQVLGSASPCSMRLLASIASCAARKASCRPMPTSHRFL